MRKILALLALVSANAFAATSNLQFSGTASATCSFSAVNPGTLAVNMAQTAQIGTSVSGGTPGTFSIQYLGTPTVTIEEIQGFIAKPNGVSDSDFNYTTSVSSGSSVSYTANNGVLSGTYSGGNADQLTVNVLATKSNGQSVPLGTYSANSVITCQ